MTSTLFQIFYDQESKSRLDLEFTPYDNTNRGNDSWHEYSVIRDVFLDRGRVFSDEEYIGFFSPRFHEKVSMTGAEVRQIVSASSSDVISFSPEFKQSSIFQNSFYQGEKTHPGLLECSQKVVESLGLKLDLSTMWQDRHRIIFSNYFVARYRIWKQWLELSEAVYAMANNPADPLFSSLNQTVTHRRIENKYCLAIFIIERVISIMLEVANTDAQVAFKLPKNSPTLANWLLLDAIKSAVIKSDMAEYSGLFFNFRKFIFSTPQSQTTA